MSVLTVFLTVIVAIAHFYFLVLEMFLWTTPKGIKTFKLKSEEFAKETKILAANQGLYNGFLAVALVYSIITNDTSTAILFLICVIVAGIYGSYSTKQIKLFYVQGVPALLALLTFLF